MNEKRSIKAICTAIDAIKRLETARAERNAEHRKEFESVTSALDHEMRATEAAIERTDLELTELDAGARKLVRGETIRPDFAVRREIFGMHPRQIVRQAGECLVRLEQLSKEIEETPKYRKQWNDSIAALEKSCDRLESVLEESSDPFALKAAVFDVNSACYRAARALKPIRDDPAKKARFDELASRANALEKSAAAAIQKGNARAAWLAQLVSTEDVCRRLEESVIRGVVPQSIVGRAAETKAAMEKCESAAAAYKCEGEDAERHQSMQRRVDAALVAASKALRERQRRERLTKIAWASVLASVLAIVVGAAVHFALLSQTEMSFTLEPEGDLVNAEAATEVLWDGKSVYTIKEPLKQSVDEKIAFPHFGKGALEIRSTDFDPITRVVGVAYGTNAVGRIVLRRSVGTLRVECDAPDIVVAVRRAGGAPVLSLAGSSAADLPTGAYVVEARKGFASRTERVRIERGQVALVSLAMPRGMIRVLARPDRVRATVRARDGELVKAVAVPFTLEDVKAGEYSVELSCAGVSTVRTVSVAGGQVCVVNEILPLGSIRVEAPGIRGRGTYEIRRAGAVEGRGQVPAVLSDWRLGNVTVDVSDGRFTKSVEVSVPQDDVAAVSVPFEYGAVEVQTDPTGASIELLSGERVVAKGTSPFSADALLSGDYKCRMALAGAAVAEMVTVQSGGTSRRRFDLPVGTISVSPRVPAAKYVLRSVGGDAVTVIEPKTSVVVPLGEYYLDASYGRIASRHTVTVEHRTSLVVDGVRDTTSLSLVGNLFGIDYKLKRDGEPSFSISGTMPETIEYLPPGTYSLSWAVSGWKPGGGTRTIQLTGGKREERCVVTRTIAFEVGGDPQLRAAIAGAFVATYPETAELLPFDYERVWNAVFAEARAGLFKEGPWKFSKDSGFLFTKGYSYEDSWKFLADSKMCLHVVLVTEMLSGVEVRVATPIWTSHVDVPERGSATIENHSSVDTTKSAELSAKFLAAVKKRLGVR